MVYQRHRRQREAERNLHVTEWSKDTDRRIRRRR